MFIVPTTDPTKILPAPEGKDQTGISTKSAEPVRTYLQYSCNNTEIELIIILFFRI